MMTHEEASELIGAFALHAVEPSEVEQMEQHLEQCPRCRAELDSHREVAAAIGNSVEPLPEGLWTSIANRLPERKDADRPPMPKLRLKHLGGAAPNSASRRRRRPDRRPRPAGSRLAAVGALAVAAAAAAAVLGINLVRTDDQVARLQRAMGTAGPTAVEAALNAPGHHMVSLEGAGHKRLAKFVLVPDGRGYLVTSALPGLPNSRTYQLWAIVGGQPISIGLLGQSPYQSTFTLDGHPAPTKLAITVEPAGGSVVPTSPLVASGTV
ncbi:MAG TPA: anti-sigma factor [Acidimicrobiales bacterium]|nr:anti-sigma factor [Acidimicrobiales bacterium]